MTVNPRPIHIFMITGEGRRPRTRLMAVLQATSGRRALEEFSKTKGIRDPVIVGNTMSGKRGKVIQRWVAQDAK